MSFPINPVNGQVYLTNDGAIYTYEGSLKTWVQSVTGRVPLKNASSLQAGTMSQEDYHKVTRLLLPPPESTLTVDGCEYDRGYLEFASGDKNVMVRPRLAVQNIDEFGDSISKDYDFQIHEFTYGIDFSLDLTALLSELKDLGRVVYDGYQGEKGDTGITGPPGMNTVWAGPQGETGARGASAECSYSHSAETFAAVPVEDTNKVLVGARITDDPADVNNKILTFDRKVLGTLRPVSQVTVSSSQSPWLMTFDTSFGVNAPNYIDIDALVDNIHRVFESKLLDVKSSYESIVSSWISQMSKTFDSQKSALSCALERCISKNKNVDSRKHMESVAGSAVGKAQIVINDKSSGDTVDGCTDPGSGWVKPPTTPTAPKTPPVTTPTTPTPPTTTPPTTTPTTPTPTSPNTPPTTPTPKLIGYKLFIDLGKDLRDWWSLYNRTYCDIIKIQDAVGTGNTSYIKDFIVDIFIPIGELELKTYNGKNYFSPDRLTTLTALQRAMKFFNVEQPQKVTGVFNNRTRQYDYPPLCKYCFREGYGFGDFVLDFYNNGDSLFETGPKGTYRLGTITLTASISSFCRPELGSADVYPTYERTTTKPIYVGFTPVYETATTTTPVTTPVTTPTSSINDNALYKLRINLYQAVYNAFKAYNDAIMSAADPTKCKPVDLGRINQNELTFEIVLKGSQLKSYKMPDSNYLSNTAANAGSAYLSTYFSQIGSLRFNGQASGGEMDLRYKISGNCKTPDVRMGSGTFIPGSFISVSTGDPVRPIIVPFTLTITDGNSPTTPLPPTGFTPLPPTGFTPLPPTGFTPLPPTGFTPLPPTGFTPLPPTGFTPLPPTAPTLAPGTGIPPTGTIVRPPGGDGGSTPPPKPASVKYYFRVFSGDLVDLLISYGFDFTNITINPTGVIWRNYWESEHNTFDGLLPRIYPQFWGIAWQSLTGWTKAPDKGYRDAKVTISQFHDQANVKSAVTKNQCTNLNTDFTCTLDLVLSGAYGKSDFKKSFSGSGKIWTECTFAPTSPTPTAPTPTPTPSPFGWRPLSAEVPSDGAGVGVIKPSTVYSRETVPYPVHIDSAYVNSIINSYKLSLPAGKYVATIKVADAKVGKNFRSNAKFTYMSNGKKKYSSFIFKGEFDNLPDSRDVYEGLAVGFDHSGGVTEWWLSIEPGLIASGVVSIAVVQEEMFSTQSVMAGYCSMSLQDIGVHQNSWQSQNCDGCVVTMLGQDYAVISINSDSECYKMFRSYGKVAFAFPTFNGIKLLSRNKETTFKYDQAINEKALGLIKSGKYFRSSGNLEFDVVLFPI